MIREDRQALYNQFEILKHLDPTQAAKYATRQAILVAGYTKQYSEIFDVDKDEADAAMQQEVWDTLEMFAALHRAKNAGWVPSKPSRAIFDGFDMNNDDHYFYAEHLIDTEGRFPELAPNRNSHSIASVVQYRKMIAVWHGASNKHSLTHAEAEDVINA